jgi:hypothetical protein
MPKPSPSRNQPDPMSGVVDRLLAQLPGLQGEPIVSRPLVRANTSSGTVAVSYRPDGTTPREWLGAWTRVLLGLAVGVMMVGWPYLHTCGLSLSGYLGAVLTVIVTGMWAAVYAWRHRVALAHVVALIVVLYGFALVLAEALPRSGYAMQRATWQCEDMTPSPSWSASLFSQSVRSRT